MPTAEYMRKYRQEHPEKAKEWSDRSNEGRTPIERAAHDAVKNALKNGTMQAQPCEICGDLNSETHHDDYTKPLDVRWLCKIDHKVWHRDHDLTQNRIPLFPGFETEYVARTPLAGLHPRIQAMHKRHGSTLDKTCKDCKWLIKQNGGTRDYFKCYKSNITHGAATDWRQSWPACGLYEKEKK